MEGQMAKIPKTAKQATKAGYKKVSAGHGVGTKQQWVMLKQKGKWSFASAESAKPAGRHTVCYYNPATGLYDDCHTVED
jgi:hypothetical protein